MRAVHEPVEDSVGERGVADVVVPVLDGQLAGDEGGTHADEIETSMLLYIAPVTVEMTKAVKDFNPDQPGPLTRDPAGRGVYSPIGIWGDPTLATLNKGRQVTEVLVEGILAQIEDLRRSAVPEPALGQ